MLVYNFKFKIILISSLIVLILWLCLTLMLKYNFENDFKNKKAQESNFERSLVEDVFSNGIFNATSIAKKISTQYSRSDNNKNHPVKFLKNYWDKFIKEYHYLNLRYYDANYKQYDISGHSKFDTETILGESDLRRFNSKINPVYFFKCTISCQLFVTKTLSSKSFGHGIIQINLPIDYLIEEALSINRKMDIAVFKKLTKGEGVKINQFILEYASNIDKFKAINDLYDFHFSSNSRQAVFLHKNDDYYVLNRINKYSTDSIEIVTYKKIHAEYDESKNRIYVFVFYSLLLLIFFLLALYWLLSREMVRLSELHQIFSIIGQKDFSQAKSLLNNRKRDKAYDEIDFIYNKTLDLTWELEETHEDLTSALTNARFMADHDSLTGIYNRRRFTVELEKTINEKTPFALISLDLNHFKLVNDSFGHDVGDILLVEFSKVLLRVVGNNGIVGRMGGDEFSIIILSSKREDISCILENISENTKKIQFCKNSTVQVSTSIGASLFPINTKDIKTLTTFSDISMYENKKFRYDNFHFYTGNETLVKEEKITQFWNDLIDKSINNDFFEVCFQSIVENNQPYKVFALESLCRIIIDDTIYYPNNFVKYAENNKKIICIDKIMLKKTLAIIAKEKVHEKVSVNLSCITISEEGFSGFITDLISKYEVRPEQIIFELTETSELEDMKSIKKIIRDLRVFGFEFAIDDFGSGFSSFSYLADLGVNYLKIDKSLIKKLSIENKARAIVDALILLVNNLEISIIAEGVEDKKTFNYLKDQDIAYLQGFYFSKPSKKYQQNISLHSSKIIALPQNIDSSTSEWHKLSNSHEGSLSPRSVKGVDFHSK